MKCQNPVEFKSLKLAKESSEGRGLCSRCTVPLFFWLNLDIRAHAPLTLFSLSLSPAPSVLDIQYRNELEQGCIRHSFEPTMSPSPRVTMHPQNSRSNPAQSSPTNAFSDPLFSIEDLVACPPRPLRRPSLTPTQSSYNGPSHSSSSNTELAAHHGLTDWQASAFPLLSTNTGDAMHGIRVISAAELAKLQVQYSKEKLPEHVLFPWLHGGADVPYSPASQYFGFHRGTAATPPR